MKRATPGREQCSLPALTGTKMPFLRRGNYLHKERAGFTLIEILVALIIVGILASVALPRYGRVTERSRQAEAISILSVMRGAQLRYSADNGTYTTSTANLDIELPDNNNDGTRGDGKFFDYSLPLSPGDTDLARAARNNVSQTAGISGYTLKVDRNGNILCTTAGAGDCVDIPSS